MTRSFPRSWRAATSVVAAAGIAVTVLSACEPTTTGSTVADESAVSSSGTTSSAPASPETTQDAASAGPSTAAPSTTPTSSPTPAPKPTATPKEAAPGTALAAAKLLTVKGRAPRTGYDRDEFGPAWQDVDRNGCDTRNDILGRDLVDVGYKGGTRECVVAWGTLHDPYSGKDIDFVRGATTSTAVQIDHVVALSDAWQKGAQGWTEAKRTQLANDPLNLLAADGPLNQSKGDGDAATWLPPNKKFRCDYVARQVAVKRGYGLWVTAAEQDAMVRVLTTCPAEKLPKSDPVPGPGGADLGPSHAPTPKPKATPKPTKKAAKQPAADVYYQNCTAVWDAGAGPIYAGDPGYSRKLDRDGDGVGCEYRP